MPVAETAADSAVVASSTDNGWQGNRGEEYEGDEKAHKDELRDGIHDYPALQQEESISWTMYVETWLLQ